MAQQATVNFKKQVLKFLITLSYNSHIGNKWRTIGDQL